MFRTRNKHSVLFVLCTFLLVVAVPGQAICTCDHTTSTCCGNEPAPVEKQGCCSSPEQEDVTSPAQTGCSPDPVPSGTMTDTHGCMHVKVLPVAAMTSAQDVNPEKSSGAAKFACGDFVVQTEPEIQTSSVFPIPRSDRDIASPAPAYVLFASLII